MSTKNLIALLTFDGTAEYDPDVLDLVIEGEDEEDGN